MIDNWLCIKSHAQAVWRNHAHQTHKKFIKTQASPMACLDQSASHARKSCIMFTNMVQGLPDGSTELVQIAYLEYLPS